MIKVKANVDETFVNLPSHEQAKQVIANSDGIIKETRRLIKALAIVNQSTEEQIKEATENLIEEGGKFI